MKMIAYHKGDIVNSNGMNYVIGDRVEAIKGASDYGGLKGEIVEIRTGKDKETDNEDIDIYCEFDMPEDLELIKELEDRFTKLYRTPKTIKDISIDLVIMAPEMIRKAS